MPLLAIADAVTLLLVTWAGFAFHGEGFIFDRYLANAVPVLAGWALAAPALGLYRPAVFGAPAQTWRVLIASALAVPFGVWLRGLWLNAPILPIFVAVMLAVVAAALLILRLAAAALLSWKNRHG